MTAYYNEIDPQAAQWLRNLIAAGLIAPGGVDERSIVDVAPSDLVGFDQCHFFAGIGVWSHALRAAGWPDERHVWTGSCPCQPFSASGDRRAFDDERHLWPAFFRLIRECRPGVVFGEQVASPVALAWLDHVQADMEGAGYAFAPFDLCAAGFGAPHIRQRLFFVAESGIERREGVGLHLCERGPQPAVPEIGRGGEARRLADADGGISGDRELQPRWQHGLEPPDGGARNVGDPDGARGAAGLPEPQEREEGHAGVADDAGGEFPRAGLGPTAGFWSDAEWLACRDGKARPVEPGSFPLVDGATGRLVRLRAYGNAIVAPVAQELIGAYMNASQQYAGRDGA